MARTISRLDRANQITIRLIEANQINPLESYVHRICMVLESYTHTYLRGTVTLSGTDSHNRILHNMTYRIFSASPILLYLFIYFATC